MRYATGSFLPSARVCFMRRTASPSAILPFLMSYKQERGQASIMEKIAPNTPDKNRQTFQVGVKNSLLTVFQKCIALELAKRPIPFRQGCKYRSTSVRRLTRTSRDKTSSLNPHTFIQSLSHSSDSRQDTLANTSRADGEVARSPPLFL